MFGNLLPFLMFGILLAAILSKPLSRIPWISLPVALVILGFVSSEIWVGLGMDTGLRWQILRDLVFYLLLPILIFEAAINIDTDWLKREAVLIGLLSVPFLLIAAVIAAGIILFLNGSSVGGSWALALLIGSMVSATDPAMISGVLGRNGKAKRVEQILEGESLINDATTITLFVMISGLLITTGTEVSAATVVGRFALILLGFSGVVATLTAGLTVAWRQRMHRSEEDIAFALDSWQILGFCANAMLFFAVGMSITVQMFQDHWPAMLLGVFAALVSRAIIVFFGLGPVSMIPGVGKLGLSDQNLILWGGIRGAIAIALALSLSMDIPHWYTIQSTVYGVALFSLVVQTPLLPYLVAGKKKVPETTQRV